MTDSKIPIAFLLGSGISRPAGLPCVEELTKTILANDSFLQELSSSLDDYYHNAFGRAANYEDLFYVAGQLADEQKGETNDPLVARASEMLCRQCKIDLSQLTQSLNHISGAVSSSLRRPPKQVSHLQILKSAWSEAPLFTLDVFTLNHDLLIEQYLSEEKIPLVDGFDAAINGVRYWNPTLFRADAASIRLLKLHGSINWYRFRPDGSNSWYDDVFGIYQGQYVNDARDPHGRGRRRLTTGPYC